MTFIDKKLGLERVRFLGGGYSGLWGHKPGKWGSGLSGGRPVIRPFNVAMFVEHLA